jgi:hypothetical protein
MRHDVKGARRLFDNLACRLEDNIQALLHRCARGWTKP